MRIPTPARSLPAALIALFTAASLGLAGCGSWDEESAGSPGERLRESASAAAGEQPDPRSLTGVSEVEPSGDIEPVAEDPEPSLPVTLTDEDGQEVEVTDVSRILALDIYGTYSKTIAGLGLADNLVGRTVSSTEPAVEDLPVVTEGGHGLSIEAILELEPTVVLVDHSVGPPEAIEQLRDAGVATVVLPKQRSIDTIGEGIRGVAEAVGLPEEGEKLAERSERELEENLATIREMAPEDPLRLAFLYVRGTGGVFFIMGPENGTGGLIESLGAVDAAKEAGVEDMRPANAESLAELNPDAFIMMTEGLKSTGGIEGLLERPGVEQTLAGRNQRVVTVPDGESLSFGPQTGDLLLRTAIALYNPDLAGDE